MSTENPERRTLRHSIQVDTSIYWVGGKRECKIKINPIPALMKLFNKRCRVRSLTPNFWQAATEMLVLEYSGETIITSDWRSKYKFMLMLQLGRLSKP